MNQAQINIIRDLLRDLKAIVKRYDSVGEDDRNAFYLPHEVQQLWHKKSIKVVLGLQSHEHVELVYSQMTCLLTILVTIHASGSLQHFTDIFFWGKSQPRITDEALPLRKADIYWYDNEPAMLDIFFKAQFMFKPYCFDVTDDELTVIDPKFRLPFEEDPKLVARGGYGQASVAKICPAYFRENDTVNYQTKLVALKKIASGEIFEIESRNLRVLKKSIRSARAVMVSSDRFTSVKGLINV
jgi:hypothetical protein